jgi:hypothetical protein
MTVYEIHTKDGDYVEAEDTLDGTRVFERELYVEIIQPSGRVRIPWGNIARIVLSFPNQRQT